MYGTKNLKIHHYNDEKKYLKSQNLALMGHTSNLSDLAPCYFRLNYYIKQSLSNQYTSKDPSDQITEIMIIDA